MSQLHAPGPSGAGKTWQRAVVPTAFFAIAGVVLLPVLDALGWGFMAFLGGVPMFLQMCALGTTGFWPRSQWLLLAIVWAVGMQELWFPYLVLTWRRQLGRRVRAVLFVGACLALTVLNFALAMLSAVGPSP